MRPQLTFGQLLTTTGRLSRSGFWTYQLAVMGSFLLLGLVLNFIKSENIQIIIVLPYILFVIFTAWIVQIKRWHDLNRSGWWCLTNFIPIFNLYAIIMCSFIKGTDGDNRFGSDPLAPLTPRHQPTTTVTPPASSDAPRRFAIPSAPPTAPTQPTSAYYKVACALCNGHIEYPAGLAGQVIDCPHCHQAITLPA